MKQLLLFWLLAINFIYSAEELSFLIRFEDTLGIYRIKVEMVKNVKRCEDTEEYDSLYRYIEDYEQEDESKSLVIPYLTIPQGTEYLRISVRSGKNFSIGWRHYFPILDLQIKMGTIKRDKMIQPGIMFKNQFENVLKTNMISYTIRADSVYNVG